MLVGEEERFQKTFEGRERDREVTVCEIDRNLKVSGGKVHLRCVTRRNVSSKISGEEFSEVCSYISGNFRKFVNYLYESVVSKSSIAQFVK